MTDKVTKTVRQWSLERSLPYSTLLSAVREGRLPAMRFTPGGTIYVTKSAIDKFIKDAQVRAMKDDDD